MKRLSKEEIEIRTKQLLDAKIIYEWEFTGFNGFTGRIANILQWALVLFFGSLFMLFFWLVDFLSGGFSTNWSFMRDTGIFTIIIMLSMRFCGAVNSHYNYKFTPYGIYYTIDYLIPEYFYTFCRRVGWFGVAVCIIGVFVVGPMAFVGVGASALLSFPLTKMQRAIQHEVIFFSNPTLLSIVKKTHTIKLEIIDSYADKCGFGGELYYPDAEHLSKLKNLLKETLKETTFIEVDKLNDLYKHPLHSKMIDDYVSKREEVNALE